MKILPFIPLYFIFREINKNSNRIFESFFLVSCLIFVFQINDILLFFGYIRSIYFIKFYPVIVCFLSIGYLIFNSRTLEEENRIRRSRQEAIFKTTQMLAHDIKTPFTKLHAVLELFKISSSNEETKQVITERIPEIEKSLFKVESLISDILSYCFSTKLAIVSIEPNSLIKRVIQQLISNVDCKKIEVNRSILCNTLIDCDQSKITRALLNISKNAVEAMNGKGKLQFEVSQIQEGNNTYLKITISNTGPSIPKSDQKKIFESFYTNTKDGGTGLGLSIAKTFIDAHGGKIWCESQNGCGAQFIVLLPLKKRHFSEEIMNSLIQNEDSHIKKEHQFKETKLHVLIVEDDPIFQENISNTFEEYQKQYQFNFYLEIAHNYESGLAKITTNTPDLLIVDLDLGEKSKNGLQLISETRKLQNRPFICVHSSQIDHFKIDEKLVDLILTKPMKIEKIKNLLTAFFEKKQLASEIIPIVIILDDELEYLHSWSKIMTDADVRCYSDHEIFWDEIVENSILLTKISSIIIDYFFPGTNVDKLKLVRALRNKGFKGHIILSSNVPYNNEHADKKDRFDFVINKAAIKYSDLIKITSSTKNHV